jgi:ribonuclease-3
MSAHLETLEVVLGHHFENRELLERSLTHKSRVYEKNSEEPATDNEQLEFLGDAILGFIVSEALVARHPKAGFPNSKLTW